METRTWLLGGAAALLVTGCGGGTDGPGTGQLTMAVTDAPVDEAAAVVVGFTGMSLKPASGPALEYHFCMQDETAVAQTTPCETPEMRQINLLGLQGGAREVLLDSVEVPAGRYNWVRLHVSADGDAAHSYLEDTQGGTHALTIPSGAETGLKLVRGFTVPVGGHADFTIDFDLRQSVHQPESANQAYRLRPALRLVDTAASGAIAGEVDAALLQDEACTGGDAVYVFAGHDAELQDVRGEAGDPLVSAAVVLDEAKAEYGYHAAYLAPAEYTVAFTCQAQDDEPDQTDVMAFGAAANVTVVAGEVAAADLAP